MTTISTARAMMRRRLLDAVNCDQVAEQLQSLADEFLNGKLTRGEFLQDLNQLTDILNQWAAMTPAASS